MKLFKRLAKAIGKTAKRVGKNAPGLLIESLNLGSGGTVGLVAKALGLGGVKDIPTLEKHIFDDPEKSLEALIEMERTKRNELEAIIEDRKNARELAQTYASSHDWTLRHFLPFLSTVILLLFAWMFFEIRDPLQNGQQRSEAVLMLIGAMIQAVAQMISFWFGQADKDRNHRMEREKNES